MKRVDETGSVEPSEIGGHKAKAISGEYTEIGGSQSIKGKAFSPSCAPRRLSFNPLRQLDP